jgi:hypothetical protein
VFLADAVLFGVVVFLGGVERATVTIAWSVCCDRSE